MKEHYLWTEIYRPQTVSDCVLPANLKRTFNAMIEEGEIPNMLLSGAPGTGKTTVARALCQEMGMDTIFINASKNGNIDTLRNQITGFSETISLFSDTKVVILDEADYLNSQSTQPALRSFIEETSLNTRFILTCNYPNRIIEPLQSRLQVVDFSIQETERDKIASAMMKRIFKILKERGVEFQPKAVASLIMTHLPDFRKILSELQSYARQHGKIDKDVVFSVGAEETDTLISILKDPKRFKDLREWVASHKNFDFNKLLSVIKPAVLENVAPGIAVIESLEIMQDANRWATFVPDMDLHVTHMLAMLMGVDWK